MGDERLNDYIERVASQAPPLTSEQRDRIALLLRPPQRRRIDLSPPLDVGGQQR